MGHSIYLSEKGNKNPRPKDQGAVSIFEKTSVVSSCILRELFADVTKIWKLKYLSEKVNCSIGQVSKLMKVLVENAWVEKLPDGYKVIDPESLLLEWSKDYRVIDESVVVSPLQIYLDCMQIKGKGKAKDAYEQVQALLKLI